MDKSRYFKNLLGLALLPLCISITLAFHQEVIKKSWNTGTAYFFLGASIYLFIHLFFHKPIVSYVTGHELTHAMWGFIFGAKIKKMKIGRAGGNVAMSKTNIFVNLVPYAFPIYTILIMLLYFVINLFWHKEWLADLTVFLIGATFSFHVVLSLCALKLRQSDLRPSGFLLSMALIYLANIFVLTVIFTLISRTISLGSFLITSLREGEIIYTRLINAIAQIIMNIIERVKN